MLRFSQGPCAWSDTMRTYSLPTIVLTKNPLSDISTIRSWQRMRKPLAPNGWFSPMCAGRCWLTRTRCRKRVLKIGCSLIYQVGKDTQCPS